MKTTLRPGKAHDLEALLELRRDCYPAQLDMQLLRRRFSENPRFRLEDDLVVAEQEGRLIGNALGIPFHCFAPGKRLVRMCGLASVAVHPLQRRQGIANQLIREVLSLGRRRGDVVAGLFAFEYGFYQRQGWAPVSRAERYFVNPKHLPDIPKGSLPLRSLAAKDWEKVSLCYHEAEENAGRLALHRGPGVWSEILGSSAIRSVGVGDLEGYLLFEYQACRDQPLSSEVVVHELVALNGPAYQALLGFLHRLQEQVVHILFPATPGDPFPLMWSEQKQPASEMMLGEHYSVGHSCVGTMMRWIDPARALVARGYPGHPGAFTLRVDDPLEKEPGFFRFALKGEAESQAIEAQETDLSADVGTWTQIWAGALRPSQAHKWGRLRVSGADSLDFAEKIFPTEQTPFVHGLDCY